MTIKIPDGKTVYVDIDETLIEYLYDVDEIGEFEKTDRMYYTHNGVTAQIRPIKENIELLAKCKLGGAIIVAWSQQGSDHVERIISKLNIYHLVDLIVSKPSLYIDDLPFEHQGIRRMFKGENK